MKEKMKGGGGRKEERKGGREQGGTERGREGAREEGKEGEGETRKGKTTHTYKHRNHLQVKTRAYSYLGASPMRTSLCFTDREKKSDISVQLQAQSGPKGKSHRRTSGWQTLRNTTPASSSFVYAITACPLSTQNMFWGWKPVLCANKVWSDNAACLSWNSLSLHGRAALSQADFGTFLCLAPLC